IHPSFFARAEQVIEELVGQHLRRQRTVVPGPAHVALDALAERLLRHADLNRAEARLLADLRRYRLIDRRPARAVPGKWSAAHDAADGLVVAVAGPGGGGRLVIEAAEHVDVAAEGREGRERGREAVIGAGLVGDPVALGDAVAVEPEHEAALDGLLRAAFRAV